MVIRVELIKLDCDPWLGLDWLGRGRYREFFPQNWIKNSSMGVNLPSASLALDDKALVNHVAQYENGMDSSDSVSAS